VNQSVCVCIPGGPFEPEWVLGWSGLFVHLLQHGYQVKIATSRSNNIYQARELCVRTAMSEPASQFLLWIDSDNPPTVANFELLMNAMKAEPVASIIGAWYRLADRNAGTVEIAAGNEHLNLSEAEVLGTDRLMFVDYVGFGFCLMKAQVIRDIGIEACFRPLVTKSGWMTDDAGFCRRARDKGHSIFVHPGAFVHHLKTLSVPSELLAPEPHFKLSEVAA
jgi:GT2 family glycosyltransferase